MKNQMSKKEVLGKPKQRDFGFVRFFNSPSSVFYVNGVRRVSLAVQNALMKPKNMVYTSVKKGAPARHLENRYVPQSK